MKTREIIKIQMFEKENKTSKSKVRVIQLLVSKMEGGHKSRKTDGL